MTQDIHHIKSSIFYNEEAWPKLISDGISPFLKRYQDLDCNLIINEEKGPNIRVVIATRASDFNAIASDLHQHFSRFFEQHPSQPAVRLVRQSFFMDFPVNRIQYNLFHHKPFVVEFQDTVLPLNSFFSDFWRVLLNQKPEVLEDMLDNRFILSLQLSLLVLFCVSSDPRDAYRASSYMLAQCLASYSNASTLVQEMEKEFLPYQRDLLDLVGETWKNVEMDSNKEYEFYEFKELFKKLSKLFPSPGAQDNKFVVHSEVIKKMIHDLHVQNELAAIYFLKRSLENYQS